MKVKGIGAVLSLVYAFGTLAAQGDGGRLECASLERGYRWRGVMLDEARHFFGKDAVKRLLDRMAEHRLNVFHWHLTDDQGWRIEIRRYPNLTRRGSVRKLPADMSKAVAWTDVETEGYYGPYFYTHDDIREIVAYAGARGIRVVPEIDMPGHSLAALASYPELCCFPDSVRHVDSLTPPGYNRVGRTIRTYCIGNDDVLRFLKGVLDEVCELFPDEVVHIGGDEAPPGNWKECPKCQARMAKEGLKAAEDLQGWLMDRIIDHLAAKGRRAMGWDEIAERGRPDPRKVIVQYWHGHNRPKRICGLLEAGYDVVMSPISRCYFNMSQGIPGDTHAYFPVPKVEVRLDDVERFDPAEGVPEKLRNRILGAECCNWTELTPTEEDLNYKMWPRTAVFARRLHELAPMGEKPISVQLRQTAGGPQVFVDGKAVRPRFFYGSPTCLCNISGPRKTVLKIPFAADRDTAHGCIALDGYPGVDPIWYSDAKLVDLTAGTTNVVQTAEDETNTLHYVADGLTFKKGHRYHYVFTHRATRPRTYFTIEVSYEEDGRKTKLPYYYGDTLGDTVAIAAKAEVDFVTFSSDSSWGCEGWWNPPEEPEDYSKIDREFERLVKINPKALLVPRIMTDAPAWLHARHPEMRMVYEPHCSLEISSVSSRTYRKAACEAVEGLSRHLREKFPRNYAGLQISGQNSAEWFYMLSQSEYLSGYDPATRDAFREWLKARGEADWATADVPAYAERRKPSPPKRVVDFARFRNREMASFLAELGAAAKRGSGGNALTFFFYGYSWELGGGIAPETGHFDFGWLMRNAHGKIDGFSSPLSYSSRNLTGSTVMMSAAESVTRNGYLWFNEIDHRTHHEEMWDHMAVFTPYSDPKVTREMFMRDSAADILRGYGDWWMDLFGRGWFRDEDIWKVRAELNGLDDMMAGRKGLYAPQIASVVNEDSYFCGGCSGQRRALMNRKGFATCGADYGQYLLSDVLENPPASVKLFYLAVANDLASDVRAKLEALKAMRSDAVFVENVTPGDITAEAIAARARKAGVHCFTAPGVANVCSAEGVVLVQALKEGPLAIDFGSSGTVRDALTGAAVCNGPKVDLPFRIGETRLFRLGE